MTINFIPNDPLAQGEMPLRSQPAKPNRPAASAGFDFPAAPAESPADPGTPQFLYWQVRETILTATEVWEQLNGPLTKWARSPTPKRLSVGPDEGSELNAYYNGEALDFFHHTSGTKTTFSGASTDVVAHECGHAFLDVIRPQLWAANLPEIGAFHEAFGDCMAILVALADRNTRIHLLQVSPNLTTPSFVEATMEDLADGVRRALGANHPAAEPRHALNTFQWALPTTLPSNGPPAVLTSEVHSFSRVFTGCFYDLIQIVFASLASQNEAQLWKAAQTAAKLLIEGAKNAPITARFFQAVGRAMVLADRSQNGGANAASIGQAFAKHGIVLGSAAMMVPKAALKGKAPTRKGSRMAVAALTLRDIRSRIGAASTRSLLVETLQLGDTMVGAVMHRRPVGLAKLSSRLRGVVAYGDEPVIVGGNNARAAAIGSFPEAATTEDEVLTFIEALLKHGSIDLGESTGKRKRAAAGKSAIAGAALSASKPTHRIKRKGKLKTVERVRFACGCGSAWR